MDYRLELLPEDTFERLINRICQDLLGIGVISFSKGKDGGKDGKFTGTSRSYPSEISPWSGQFIIQAKHTDSPIASCSERYFEGVVDKEIEKIKKLKANSEIDCYLLFTNRKYTGLGGEELLQRIKVKTGLDKVVIFGKETINDQFIKRNKSIIKEFNLDSMHIPFEFSEAEIKNIIGKFYNSLPEISASMATKVEKVKVDYDRIAIEEKNKKNSLSKDYFESVVLSNSLQDFEKIASFLQNPINYDLKEQFFDIVSELQNIIVVKRENFSEFEEIFIFIYKQICDGADFRGKRYIYTLLHYMYFDCLIGIK